MERLMTNQGMNMDEWYMFRETQLLFDVGMFRDVQSHLWVGTPHKGP
jgi:hypothetical protein